MNLRAAEKELGNRRTPEVQPASLLIELAVVFSISFVLVGLFA